MKWIDLIKNNFVLVVIAGIITLLISWLGLIVLIAFVKQFLPILLFAGIIIIFYLASGKKHK